MDPRTLDVVPSRLCSLVWQAQPLYISERHLSKLSSFAQEVNVVQQIFPNLLKAVSGG